MLIAHTPRHHCLHTKPCGCSTQRDKDFYICACGAAYTDAVMSFPVFTCYDCGEYRLDEDLKMKMSTRRRA